MKTACVVVCLLLTCTACDPPDMCKRDSWAYWTETCDAWRFQQ